MALSYTTGALDLAIRLCVGRSDDPLERTTNMATLALRGGKPVRDRPFPPPPPYGLAERNAANEVVATGQLSGFLGRPGEGFLGGPRVQSFERAIRERFQVKHAIAMNSATSCLFASVQVVARPGDEVIVAPWSMSASAVCVLEANCIPVFADIEHETYCLDYASVVAAVTPRTKAIVLVDLFGSLPRDLEALLAFAETSGIPVIEDAAQAIGANEKRFDNGYAGTFGNVGVYSFNQHKTLQCGEGGVAVTDDDQTAEKLRAIRNHGENLTTYRGWGQNYRLGEIHAAIAEAQLGRLEELIDPRVQNARILSFQLAKLDGVVVPTPHRPGIHAYYVYAVRVPGDARKWADALTAEGVAASTYVEPLYRLPVFKHPDHLSEVEIAYRSVVVIPHVHAGMTPDDLEDVLTAFRKVHEHRGSL